MDCNPLLWPTSSSTESRMVELSADPGCTSTRWPSRQPGLLPCCRGRVRVNRNHQQVTAAAFLGLLWWTLLHPGAWPWLLPHKAPRFGPDSPLCASGPRRCLACWVQLWFGTFSYILSITATYLKNSRQGLSMSSLALCDITLVFYIRGRRITITLPVWKLFVNNESKVWPFYN